MTLKVQEVAKKSKVDPKNLQVTSVSVSKKKFGLVDQ